MNLLGVFCAREVWRSLALGVIAAAMGAGVGCGGRDEAPSNETTAGALASSPSTLPSPMEKDGTDIAVLQAWFGDTIVDTTWWSPQGHKLVDLSKCGADGDCTGEAERALTLEGHDKPSPMIGTFHYEKQRSGICEFIEVRAVMKDAALAASSFVGVGFYSAALGPWNGGVAEIAKDRLDDVGKVTLKSGEPATVLRFTMPGMCFGQGGNGDSMYHRNYSFKPFARYDADGKTTHVWDSVKDDYFLGRRTYPANDWVPSFDRQDELLSK